MLDINLIFLFSIATLILMLTPGTDMVFVISNSLSSGTKAGVASVLGVASGAYIHVILATVGVASVVAASPALYNSIVIAGALYVAWIGWSISKHKGIISTSNELPQRAIKKIYMQGIMTNLLNPKAIIFTLSFFPQFISVESGDVSQQMLFLGIILVIIMIAVELPLVLFAGTIRGLLSESGKLSKYIYRITGGSLIALSIYISISRLIINA